MSALNCVLHAVFTFVGLTVGLVAAFVLRFLWGAAPALVTFAATVALTLWLVLP